MEIAGPEMIKQVATSLLEAMRVPIERFTFKTTFRKLEGGERFNDISTCKVIHPIPTIAYRIDRRGKSVCYSGDTSYCEGVVNLAKGCDLLIHEAVVTAPSKAHATPAEAARVASKAHAKRLVLFHWPAEFEGREEVLTALAKAEYDGEVIVSKDFLSIEL